MPKDRNYMRRALKLAAKGRGTTSPNPMVGAIIVKDGEIVGEGYHRRAGGPHAEVHALDAAGDRAHGATMYTSLEPCVHRGRTPPCTEAIIEAGVKKVVAAASDPNPQVAGKGLERLREAGLEVECGLLKEEAEQLNEAFITYITCGRPFIISKTAMSLDGKVATRTGDARWITSRRARTHAHRLRSEVDAIMVGIGTVLTDDPRLTVRLSPGPPPIQPLRIVLDSSLRIPQDSRLVADDSPENTLIATTPSAPEAARRELAECGVEILTVDEDAGRVDIRALLVELARREITSVLVEGGPGVNAGLLECGLIDKYMFYIAPKLIGGRKAPSPFGGRGPKNMDEIYHLDLYEVERVGDGEVLITAYPKNRREA